MGETAEQKNAENQESALAQQEMDIANEQKKQLADAQARQNDLGDRLKARSNDKAGIDAEADLGLKNAKNQSLADSLSIAKMKHISPAEMAQEQTLNSAISGQSAALQKQMDKENIEQSRLAQEQGNYTGSLATASGTLTGEQANANQANQNALQNAKDNNPTKKGLAIAGDVFGMGTGIAKGVGSIFSDQNLKTDIKPTGESLIDSLKKIKSVSYKYKKDAPVKNTNEKQIGILAQDLEKTPMKNAVIDTPLGKKVDTDKLTMANTAVLSEFAKKVKELEQKMKGGNKNG